MKILSQFLSQLTSISDINCRCRTRDLKSAHLQHSHVSREAVKEWLLFCRFGVKIMCCKPFSERMPFCFNGMESQQEQSDPGHRLQRAPVKRTQQCRNQSLVRSAFQRVCEYQRGAHSRHNQYGYNRKNAKQRQSHHPQQRSKNKKLCNIQEGI